MSASVHPLKRHWRWMRWALLAVAVALLLAGSLVAWNLRQMGFLRAPVFEIARPAIPEIARPAVLVFSKTNSFIHVDAIPAAKGLLQQLGVEQGWGVFVSDSGGVFNAEDLARFDVVVWNNVTGDVLTPEQREAFRHWLEVGGGFVALHAAGDNSHAGWPWYLDTVIRAHFIGHPMNPQFQSARVNVEQPLDPILAGMPNPWQHTDEWYSFAASPRAPDVRVLAALDETSYSPGRFMGTELSMGTDHPIIWKHCVGGGRVFYSAMGHTAESYADPAYRDVLLRAIGWAARLDPARDVSESPLACERSLERTEP